MSAAGTHGEHNRGRSASAPSEIPSRGWKDILIRVYHNITEHRVVSIGAGVAFFALLAIFPGIAALVSIYGLFADPNQISSHLESMSGVLPGGAIDVLRDQLSRLATQGKGTLGLSFLISLAISLWSANSGVKALFDALNVVYGEQEKRSFIKLNALSLAFTVGILVFLILALIAVVGIPIALNYIGLEGASDLLIRLLRWPVLLACIAVLVAALYRYGPSRAKPQWRWITWGSAVAAILWIIASALFSWYAGNFGAYNKTYGSLGAVIGFMTWIWISAMVILLGAELDAEMEHQTAQDTTEGAPKPMGQRQARVADTVGEAQG
jgi:membrane protein